jgi:hypothetical protein
MFNILREEEHGAKNANNSVSAPDILKSYRPDILFIDLLMQNMVGEIVANDSGKGRVKRCLSYHPFHDCFQTEKNRK